MMTQVDFYRERRLRPMLKYANDSEMSRLGDVLMRNLDSLFQGIEVATQPPTAKLCQPFLLCRTDLQWHDGVGSAAQVQPAVLHGDLWSGNIGSADGQPTVFDPAVYYGHHEVPRINLSSSAHCHQELYRSLRSDHMVQCQCQSQQA